MQYFLAVVLLASPVLADNCLSWPNGTDSKMNWWQADSGPVKVYNATPFDATGKNFEYPIHLGAPIVMKLDIDNTKNVYSAPNLLNTINIWSWGGWTTCAWSPVPTFGLLANIDACSNGVPCPIKLGRQYLDVTVDFTKYQKIINTLKDNSPYQLEYILHDKPTKDTIDLYFQARAYLK